MLRGSMQPPPGPATESTPFSTPLPSTDDQLISPLTSTAPSEVDPLIAQSSEKLDEVMNDFRRQLLQRDGSGVDVDVQGSIEVTIKNGNPRKYHLSFTNDLDDEENPIGVRIMQSKGNSTTNGQSSSTRDPPPIDTLSSALNISLPSYEPARRPSDKELEQDFVPRHKRKLEEDDLQDGDGSRKRSRVDVEPDEDIMPLITKEDLDELFVKLRDDVQEDTAEVVNHVSKLLRKWKEQWHEKSIWEYDQLNQLVARQGRGGFPGSVDETASNGVRDRAGSAAEAFPSPTPTKDTPTGSFNTVDAFRKEAKLLSSQIRWVEDCRRVAADAHDKREETWRTTSAGFHDKNRQDRENFQARMIHESSMQGRMLNQILNEVKAMSHVTMSLKWETPGTGHSPPQYAPPAPPAPPPFPGAAPSQIQGGPRRNT